MSAGFGFLSDKDLIAFGLGNQPAAGICNSIAARYRDVNELIAQIKGKNNEVDDLIRIYESRKIMDLNNKTNN
jgi:hypothetical protein